MTSLLIALFPVSFIYALTRLLFYFAHCFVTKSHQVLRIRDQHRKIYSALPKNVSHDVLEELPIRHVKLNYFFEIMHFN